MAESTRVRTVRDRSSAEIPVVTPSRASTLMVKAVRIRSALCGVISGSCSRSSMSPGSGTQITPLVCRIMKAISAGVILLAATMMSPSFSRSASSTTTTGRPAAMSLIARSTSSSMLSPSGSARAAVGRLATLSPSAWPVRPAQGRLRPLAV